MTQPQPHLAPRDMIPHSPPRKPSGVMLSAATGAGMLLLSATAISSVLHGWVTHAIARSIAIALLFGAFFANRRGRIVFAHVEMACSSVCSSRSRP